MSEEIHNRETQSSYRSIFKATSLFGGVQVYTILIQVIKSKVIAVLLGPIGVGIQGLLQSAIDLIKQATSFGISQSAVRDVAEAHGSGDETVIGRKVFALRRIVWFTGLLGLVSVLLFSPLLSKVSFGNYDYIIPFICLSIIPLLEQLCAGQKVVLQGTRRLKDLAKASAIGVTGSLIISFPLYLFLRTKGITAAMVVTAGVSLLTSWFYSRRVSIPKVTLTRKAVFTEGRNMMVMGIAMSLTGVMSMGTAYLIRSLLRQWGGTEAVGLFEAGFVIISSYVGLVFNAISTDYYPRLAAVNKDNGQCRNIVSQQGEISVLILAPLLSICIVAMPLIIRILYSEQFLPSNFYVKWACLGMMFRLASWLIAYMFIAKAESKLFIINELIASLNGLWTGIIGYKLGGLTGMGIAFTIQYFLYFIQVLVIARIRYGFFFSKQFVKLLSFYFIIVSASLLCSIFIPGVFKYIFGGLIALISCVLAFVGLNKRIGLFTYINRKYTGTNE